MICLDHYKEIRRIVFPWYKISGNLCFHRNCRVCLPISEGETKPKGHPENCVQKVQKQQKKKNQSAHL